MPASDEILKEVLEPLNLQAVSGRQKFRQQVLGVSQLLQEEDEDINDANQQMTALVRELAPELEQKPKLKEHLSQLLGFQRKVSEHHQRMKAEVLQLERTNHQQTSDQLQVSQKQVMLLFEHMQGIAEQLQQTQRQVEHMTNVGNQVKSEHEARLGQTQQQVDELMSTRDQMQAELQKRADQADSREATLAEVKQEHSDMKARLGAMEAEMLKMMNRADDDPLENDAEWV